MSQDNIILCWFAEIIHFFCKKKFFVHFQNRYSQLKSWAISLCLVWTYRDEVEQKMRQEPTTEYITSDPHLALVWYRSRGIRARHYSRDPRNVNGLVVEVAKPFWTNDAVSVQSSLHNAPNWIRVSVCVFIPPNTRFRRRTTSNKHVWIDQLTGFKMRLDESSHRFTGDMYGCSTYVHNKYVFVICFSSSSVGWSDRLWVSIIHPDINLKIL